MLIDNYFQWWSLFWPCRFGEHEGSYCTVASFGNETDAKAVAGSALAPLQVVTDNDRSLAVSQQQISPRRTNTSSNRSSRGSPSPVSPPRATIQQQQQQYRLNCFYPNYDPSHKGWYPVTATSSYSSLSPPPPMALNYQAPKSRFVQQQHPWGLAYVPTVRYLNNWPMGQMVKVWGERGKERKTKNKRNKRLIVTQNDNTMFQIPRQHLPFVVRLFLSSVISFSKLLPLTIFEFCLW
jgi:hypothetical protein